MRFQNDNPYAFGAPQVAAHAAEWERATFIRRTYAHLGGAILLFVAIEAMAFAVMDQAARWSLVRAMFGQPMSWLLVLGGFMVVSFVAEKWANSSASLSTQYAGLCLYVVGESIVFMPLLFMADFMDRGQGIITTAAVVTLVMFGGLTAFVFMTKVDLSGWGKYLTIFGFAAMGFIIVMAFIPGARGMSSFFTLVMILFASAYILYQTSNIMHQYQTSQYVAAALGLFAAVALLFWYVLRIVMQHSGD